MLTENDVIPHANIDLFNEYIDVNYPFEREKFVFPNINPEFEKFFVKNLPEGLLKYINPESYIVLRMVKPGSTARNYEFHFDAYEETVVVPLMGSDAELNGDLLICKNTRKTPGNIFLHVVQKFLYQNTLALNYFKKSENIKKIFTRISVKRGSIFVFDGVRCLHGNLPISSGERRTILIHNRKLFNRSFITKCIEQYSQYVVLKKSVSRIL